MTLLELASFIHCNRDILARMYLACEDYVTVCAWGGVSIGTCHRFAGLPVTVGIGTSRMVLMDGRAQTLRLVEC